MKLPLPQPMHSHRQIVAAEALMKKGGRRRADVTVVEVVMGRNMLQGRLIHKELGRPVPPNRARRSSQARNREEQASRDVEAPQLHAGKQNQEKHINKVSMTLRQGGMLPSEARRVRLREAANRK